VRASVFGRVSHGRKPAAFTTAYRPVSADFTWTLITVVEEREPNVVWWNDKLCARARVR